MRVELRVLGEAVAAEAPTPAGPVRLDALLPLLRALDDRVVDVAARRAVAERGQPVSCRKGCSACCRAQPVHVTPPEALALARLVEALPEPRRSAVRARFAANAGRLAEAGLRSVYLRRERSATQDEVLALWRRYFALGLVCPFLEDDACSIHPDRPFICRQFLVTTPAAMCADPFNNPVRSVPTLVRFIHAVLEVTDRFLGPPWYTVPLALALEFAEEHRPELERTFPVEEVFRAAVAQLAEQSAPA